MARCNTKISLNTKLVVSFLLVVVTTGLVAMIVGVYVVADRVVKQAQDKVRMDLNSAREVYEEHVNTTLTVVRLIAERYYVRDLVLAARAKELSVELAKVREKEGLDILTLTDESGRVLARATNPGLEGDVEAGDEMVSRVLADKLPVAGTQILSRDELLKESDSLALQAYMRFVPTPKARPTAETEETSGMVIKAAAPVFNTEGNLIAVLYGGKLLNRDYDIVDKIKSILYRGHTYKGKDIGTATIFQGDLRISTNVKTEGGDRAIGTRVSEEVYDQVILRGEPWIGRAFVVNDWYITAYEPIRDVNGKIAGILYVGVLEREYADARMRTQLLFLGITLAGMVAAVVISWVLARGIVKPVRRLVAASRKLASGDLDARVEPGRRDEIGELGETFNQMADSIEESDRRLRETTQRKLMESERLATIGRLAAGVAHEINNPLTAVMTFSHLLLEDAAKEDPRRQDLELMIHETARCRDIVRKLLDFSRESKPEKKPVNIDALIEHTLSIVTTQALFNNVKVVKKLSGKLPDTTVDPAQIQQVFTNIIVNAAEAMPEGGTLTLETSLVQDGREIETKVTDTGAGIDEKDIGKLFDPFYTTKEKGTGLGLSVTYGIVKSHEGSIGVESKLGKGTTFTLLLPVKSRPESAPGR